MMQYFPKVAATYRRPTGDYVDGRYVPDAVVENSIQIIAPQPENGMELQMLPEGDRQYEHLKTWCSVELQPNDVLTYGGKEYRVILSMDYQTDGSFHRTLIREVKHER